MTSVNESAPQHEKLNYVEFAARDLKATSRFFHNAFAWDFTWYGEEYVAFSFLRAQW